nr:hypothetical protein K-LCC10_0074 [Kaumoebavirus]
MWAAPLYHDVFSWDCANKSIACTKLKVVKNLGELLNNFRVVCQQLKDEFMTGNLNRLHLLAQLSDRIEWLTKNVIVIEFSTSCDTLEGSLLRDTTAVQRGKATKQFLSKYEKNVEYVLVEYQMAANFKSGEVSSQLVYHFCDKCDELVVVGPSVKNKCVFDVDTAYFAKLTRGLSEKNKKKIKKVTKVVAEYPNLSVGSFLNKYATNWSANKAHSSVSFVVLLALIGRLDILDTINYKHVADIGDSCLQALTHFKF